MSEEARGRSQQRRKAVIRTAIGLGILALAIYVVFFLVKGLG